MKTMKKKLLNITLTLVTITMLAACVPSRGGTTTVQGQEVGMENELEAVAVESMTLDLSDHYEQIYISGQLEAQEEYNVLPYTVGVVSEILVEVGDQVEEGDVLYILDSADLETNRDDTLVSLQRSKDQAYNSLVLAQNDLSSSKMSLENAQKNYEDNLRLFDGGFITQSAIDGYEDGLESAQIGYDRALITLQNAQSAYDGSVDSYSDTARDFSNNLEDMVVTSPIKGSVTKVDVQVDVTNNMNAGVTVTGTGNILVAGSVIERYINEVASGQDATVEIKAVDRSLKGQVTSVASSSSNSYYPIEVTLENGNGDLKAGMFAGVTVNTNLVEGIITIPKTSIIGTGSTKFVFLDQGNVASRTLVTVGRDFGAVVEITDGLSPGDALIIEGQVYLEEGTPLIVNNDTALN